MRYCCGTCRSPTRWTPAPRTPCYGSSPLPSAGPLACSPSQEVAHVAPVPAPAPPRQPMDAALITALTEDGRATYTELARPRRHHRTRCPPAPRHPDPRPSRTRGHGSRPDPAGRARRGGPTGPAVRRRPGRGLWITVQPGALEETARTLSAHRRVRFTAAATGPANLLVALAATDLDALYTFLTTVVGPLGGHLDRHHPATGDRQTHGPHPEVSITPTPHVPTQQRRRRTQGVGKPLGAPRSLMRSRI